MWPILRNSQKEGIAGPSVAATLIAALPQGDEILLAEETKIAQNVAAVSYMGMYSPFSASQSNKILIITANQLALTQ